MSAGFQPADVQGNIVRGYRKPRVRHLVLEIADRNAARKWLAAATSGAPGAVPQITTEEPWLEKPKTCFNIGLTYEGMRALGVADRSLATFPPEFIDGMSARALKLGDVGPSAPDTWPAPFHDPKRLHLIASIYADEVVQLDCVQRRALAGGGLTLLGARDGWCFDGDTVHFGFRDNISQPRFPEVHGPEDRPDSQPMASLGTVLLGYPSDLEDLTWQVPQPETLGKNGSFNAFRVLEQDVAGFENYLDTAAEDLLKDSMADRLLPAEGPNGMGGGLSRHAALREVVAANMLGRWRNGTPVALSPTTSTPSPEVSLTDFDYAGASACPFGAHIRRSNPRGGQIVQRVANHTRRIVRRGMPYGEPYRHGHAGSGPQTERGLLGNFLGANLAAQFEALACDWLNLGLQDPRLTGSSDPLVGAGDPAFNWFDLPLATGATIRLRGLPRFVHTRGGAYTFLPSISAIRFLGKLTG